MTFKKVFIIGLLSASIIGLISFGIKTKSFNKENFKPKITTPTTHYRSAIRVNAENDITPTSLNWLLNENLSNANNLQQVQTTFKSALTGMYIGQTGFNRNQNLTYDTTYNSIEYTSASTYPNLNYAYNTLIPVYKRNDNTWISSVDNKNTYLARILRFDNTPTGNLYTWLINNATPYWNNNVILTNKSPAIHQIRKANVIIENGSIINTEGTIQILLDNAISNCYVNGVQITDFNTTLNIQNQDIAIQCDGNFTNQVGYVLTINYTNTLPPIEPTPIPDPTNPINEVIDIKGLMLQILTMPFTFITQAFNVTLWPETEYAFNFAHFIMALIAIASILFIIKLFTSGFSIVSNYTNTKINKSKPQKITKAEKPKKDKS